MKYKKCWIFTNIKPNGEEGILGEKSDNTWIPFMTGSLKTAKMLKERAKFICNDQNITLRITEFTQARDVTDEELE